jgi:hypothetical protein
VKKLVVAFVLSWMVGCPGQQSAAQQVSRSEEARQEFARIKTDCQSILADPGLRPIRSKVQLNAEIQPTSEMLANEERATPDERRAIRHWAHRVVRCQAEYIAAQRQYLTPMHVTLTSGAYGSANALRAELHNGQISYGQYNRERNRLFAEHQAALTQLNAELARKDARAQHRAQQIADQQWQKYVVLQQSVWQQERLNQEQSQQNRHLACQQIGEFSYCKY